MSSLVPVLIFLMILILLEVGYLALRAFWLSEKRAVRKRLRALASPAETTDSISITRKDVASDIPWLNRILKGFASTERMKKGIEQAGSKKTPGF